MRRKEIKLEKKTICCWPCKAGGAQKKEEKTEATHK
jgi:hypothetical protein